MHQFGKVITLWTNLWSYGHNLYFLSASKLSINHNSLKSMHLAEF